MSLPKTAVKSVSSGFPRTRGDEPGKITGTFYQD